MSSYVNRRRPLSPIDNLRQMNGAKYNNLMKNTTESFHDRISKTGSYKTNNYPSCKFLHLVDIFIVQGWNQISPNTSTSFAKKITNELTSSLTSLRPTSP